MSVDLTLSRIFEDIQRGQIAPCYLIFGEDQFRVEQTLQDLMSVLVPGPERDLNVFVTDGEREDINEICRNLLSPPLMPGKKLVIIKNTRLFQPRSSQPALIRKMVESLVENPQAAIEYFSRFLQVSGWKIDDLENGQWRNIRRAEWERVCGKDAPAPELWVPKILDLCRDGISVPQSSSVDEEKDLISTLKNHLPSSNCLIMTAETADRRKNIFKQISSLGVAINLPRPDKEAKLRDNFNSQIRQQFIRAGRRITPDALSELGRKTNFDLGKARSELEKIFLGTENQNISRAEIEAFASSSSEERVFSLVAALSERDLEKSLKVLHNLLDRDTPALMILGMLAREARLLFQAKLLLESERALQGIDADYSDFQTRILPAVKSKFHGGTRIELLEQHPYVIYLSLQNAAKASAASLARNLEELVKVDAALKSTGQNPKILLESLFVRICS